MKKTICCNLFAGPGTGKSTTMADVFAKLKWMGVDCEIVTEYAKDKVWEGSVDIFNCQPYIFGKQLFRLFRLNGKVDVIITDSPILLSVVYDKQKSINFLNYVSEEFNKFRNFNIFLKRVKKYNPNGRFQNYEEAIAKDKEILDLLTSNKVPFRTFDGTKESAIEIANLLKEMVQKS